MYMLGTTSMSFASRFATLLLLCVSRTAAHGETGDHATDCNFTLGTDTYDLLGLRRTSNMWDFSDTKAGTQHTYSFNICNDASHVSTTQCLDGNTTKMNVYACLVAYGRPGVISLGDDFVMEAYTGTQPAWAGTHGVHVNISRGDACHDGTKRQLDLWIQCDPAAGAGTPEAPPVVGVEGAHCEYDILWKSSFGCRQCVDADYTKEWADSLTTCAENGNATVRYKKKSTSVCAHGVHGGVTTTPDLNEYCDGNACPHGFESVAPFEGLNLKRCRACEAGYTSTGTTCTECTGNTFADRKGSDACYACGVGTNATADHTGCTFDGGLCTYSDPHTTMSWDLAPMSNHVAMAGPVREAGHQYYLDVCLQEHSEHVCYNADSSPLVSYSCQIPMGSNASKDMGRIIGLTPFNAAELVKYPAGGLKVQLTHGSVCHHEGFAQHRNTDIYVPCNVNASVGVPATPAHSAWNTNGEVEPAGGCHYEFLWESRYGCPVCSKAAYSKQPDVCDSETGFVTPTYKRDHVCIGEVSDGSDPETKQGPDVWQDTANKRACTEAELDCKPGHSYNAESHKCFPCPKSFAGPGGVSAVCTKCAGNTYTFEQGSPECIPCGQGTTATDTHDECTKHEACKFDFGESKFDLKGLDKDTGSQIHQMIGPIEEQVVDPTTPAKDQFQYFINLCTRATANARTCAGDNGEAIKSFACQRTKLVSETFGHLKGTNLGDTMGVSQRADGNLTVSLTHGTKCHFRSQPFRQTTIKMNCDPSRISSEPAPSEGRAEHGYCHYEFEWYTIHACPVCTPSHFDAIVSACTKVSGSDGYVQTTSYIMGPQGCNHLALAAQIPPHTTVECTPTQSQTANISGDGGSTDVPSTPAANIGAGGSGDDDGQDGSWSKSAGFLITVVALSSALLVVVVAGALKYYKARQARAYSQLGGSFTQIDIGDCPA